MRTLVTGGAGFVGRHLVKRLKAQGKQVIVVDNLSSGVMEEKRSAFFFKEDCREFFKNFSPYCFDRIFHLAAVVGGRLKIEGDPLAVATDLAIDSDFFNWLAHHKYYKGKVIYFSSSAVYPISRQRVKSFMSLHENDFRTSDDVFRVPDMTYGFAKLAGEYLAKFAVETYDIDVVIYRPFSGYGEDQAFDYPFPSIIRRVVRGEDPVIVWGSGEQSRDFIYIEDVIDCVFATMDKLQPGEALNIGSGIPTTFADLAFMAGAKRVRNDPTKPEGVYYRVADTTKMRKWYKPTTTLEQGIEIVKKALTVTAE